MKALPSRSLLQFNTFGVNATAQALVELEYPQDLQDLSPRPGSDLLLGGGSNILLVDDVPGTVYLNRIRGRKIIGENNEHVLIEVAGGENWHQLVRWTLDQDLSGLENLSLIPGLAGAAPIQNIGAYGVELSSVLESVTAWDCQDGAWREFTNAECQFAYRDSRFKSAQAGRYLISSIRLRLDRRFSPHLEYAGIGEELHAMGITEPSARKVSDAVVRIRQRRLPDPADAGNAGSFFKNPLVDPGFAAILKERYPGLPLHNVTRDTAKLSAAWMIEHCGWKGHRENDAGISAQHALVLVNYGQATGRELFELARRVAQSVNMEFGIQLEPEPRIIGHAPWPG